MKTAQQRFLEDFDAMAKKYKLELLVNKGASNVGSAIFMTKDYMTVLGFSFNFQSGYCSIKFHRGGDVSNGFSDYNRIRSDEGMLYYTNGHAIRAMFTWVESYINRYLNDGHK